MSAKRAAASSSSLFDNAGWRPTETHPLAAIFPIMTDDELADLADDIKANGLIHPIIVDADGRLIDGRNRLRACEIAGVEPRIEPLNGHDARAFIVSANLTRRNLSKGQQAMALAMIYPEPDGRGRGNKSSAIKSAETAGFSQTRLKQARSILHHSPALADDVLAARKPFDEAVRFVQTAQQASKSRDVQLSELRSAAPDVAALIDDERLTLEAGLAELTQRQQRIRQAIESGRSAAARFVGVAAHLTVIKAAISLTDADLAMVGKSRAEINPFADLPEKEIAALAAAAAELKRMKQAIKGE